MAETALDEIKKLKDQLEAERAYLQEEIKLEYNHENIIGQSDGINYVFYKVEQIAGTDYQCLGSRRNRNRQRAGGASYSRLERCVRIAPWLK